MNQLQRFVRRVGEVFSVVKKMRSAMGDFTGEALEDIVTIETQSRRQSVAKNLLVRQWNLVAMVFIPYAFFHRIVERLERDDDLLHAGRSCLI